MKLADAPELKRLSVAAYRVPTDAPESDGTLSWNHTEVVVVRASAAGTDGLGWTYASRAAGVLIEDILAPAIAGESAFAIHSAWQKMTRALRNAGTGGEGMMAVAAVDIALWDLKARILEMPLLNLLGAVRGKVEIYGSGGFTSYKESRLCQQLESWTERGIGRVKMKVGRAPSSDVQRVRAARRAIGAAPELYVDANGAYSRKEALRLAAVFSTEAGVSWFEEPVPSQDLEGLRLIRDRAPTGMDVAAGEYGDVPRYFLGMIEAGAVDCMQADATRCGGITGFLKVAALCEAAQLPLSAHCAPQIHAHIGCASPPVRHVEYFHDHVRIDRILFDGVLVPVDGSLRPDMRRPGMGLNFRRQDAQRFAI